jgi:F420-dependent oxidoreductase-like protein
MNEKFKFGVFLPFYAFKGKNPLEMYAQLKKTVLEAEELGYDSVWLDDHLMYDEWPILETWTTLSMLAALTSSIHLGTLVTCNAHHNPAVLAKASASFDAISGGRLEFGIGAGCQENEHIAYGFQFDTASTRIAKMAEALEVIVSLWTQSKANFRGKYYRVEDATCEPKPHQKPHPPITIGGAGEKYALRVVAQYADRVDFGFLPTIEEYAHKLSVLERHCKDVGRNFSDIERAAWLSGQVIVVGSQEEADNAVTKLRPAGTPLEEFRNGTLVGTPQQCIAQINRYRELGVTYFILYFGDLPDTVSLKLFAEKVIKKLDYRSPREI